MMGMMTMMKTTTMMLLLMVMIFMMKTKIKCDTDIDGDDALLMAREDGAALRQTMRMGRKQGDEDRTVDDV